jgi:hypothetical protein
MSEIVKTFVLPPLYIGPVAINLFCDWDVSDWFEKAVANCWAWASLNQRHSDARTYASEDTLYQEAKSFYDEALRQQSQAGTRDTFLQTAMPVVTRIQLPSQVKAQLLHRYTKERQHA